MNVNISNPAFRDTFIFLETFEKGLKIAGYIPFIGTVSAAIRGGFAKIEMISGIAFAILALGIHLQGNAATASTYLAVGITLIAHSLLNGLRTCLEVVPFVPLVTTLPYDLYATYVVGKRFFSYV